MPPFVGLRDELTESLWSTNFLLMEDFTFSLWRTHFLLVEDSLSPCRELSVFLFLQGGLVATFSSSSGFHDVFTVFFIAPIGKISIAVANVTVRLCYLCYIHTLLIHINLL